MVKLDEEVGDVEEEEVGGQDQGQVDQSIGEPVGKG